MEKASGYVIIEGNIGVGKSTFARMLGDTLRASGIPAEYLPEPDEKTNPFLAEYYKAPAETAYKMQMHLLHQRFKSTRYAQAAALAGKGWFILDRSYFGDICFANVQSRLGFFSPAEAESYLDAHRNMREFLEPPTCAIFLDATPETCARRIGIRQRTCEADIDLGYLQSLDGEIRALAGVLDRRCPVWRLDWDGDASPAELSARASDIARRLVGMGREDWDF